MVSRSEIEAAWEGVVIQDRRSEAPDVIGFEDHLAGRRQGLPPPRLPVAFLPVPRRSGPGVRFLHLLDPEDHARYMAVTARLAPIIERRLAAAVVAERAVRATPTLVLAPFRRARRRYRATLRRLISRGPRALLVADVRQCFVRITRPVVIEVLERLGCAPEDVRDLGTLLARLEAEGVVGLPVGPAPSAILANAVLSVADVAVAAEGGRFVRWVDDYVVATPGEGAAKRILEGLRSALGRVGLELAWEKCRVAEPGELPGRLAVPSLTRERASRRDARPIIADPDAAFVELERPSSTDAALAMVGRLRSIAGPRWGGAEAAVLTGVATDPARPVPVRDWAWRALALSDPGACLGPAEHWARAEPRAARGAVAALAAIGGRRPRALLRALSGERFETGVTARWAMSGAGEARLGR